MMPGTFRYSASQDDSKSQPLPPPVAPRVTVQSWRESTSVTPPDVFGHHIRSGSVDSLDSSSGSSVSSSSSGGNHSRQLSGDSGEYIPTRSVAKSPSTSVHNPLQFIKVQSPLYKKAEHQIKLAKEVKITREKVKEGEEEWQSNLDNWKSRRRKVSEKVFQRAEEMRQIEAEELLRQQQQQQQQKKIKTFSEIVELRSQKKCSYNLDLYVGQGDDSGLGATPEPEDQDSLENHNLGIKSDTSDEITSESESADSDVRVSEKLSGKEPPKVPKKPYSWLSRSEQNIDVFSMSSSTAVNEVLRDCLKDELCNLNNPSSSELSDVEGHAADSEAVFSEDDVIYCAPSGNLDSGLESLCDSQRVGDTADSASDFSQDSCGVDNVNQEFYPELVNCHELANTCGKKEPEKNISEILRYDGQKLHFKILLKQGVESKAFGFSLKGGKDQGSAAYVDNVTSGGAADLAGLKIDDKVLSINGEETSGSSHASLIFAIKQAIYIGQLDLIVWRCNEKQELSNGDSRISKRGSSFAEKIAMFSCGLSSPTAHSTPAVSNLSVQVCKDSCTEDLKKESLVLRRRSAFENSCASGNQNKNRWSANLSSEATVGKLHHFERQHSADFSSSIGKFSSVNSASKKAPPPPIPQKPKLKIKVNDCLPSPAITSVSNDTEIYDIQTVNEEHTDVKNTVQEMSPEECEPEFSLPQHKRLSSNEVCGIKPILKEVHNGHNNSMCASYVLNNSKETNYLEHLPQMNVDDAIDPIVSCNEVISNFSQVDMHTVNIPNSCESGVRTTETLTAEGMETSQSIQELNSVIHQNSMITDDFVSSSIKSDTGTCLFSDGNEDFSTTSEENTCLSDNISVDFHQLCNTSNSAINNNGEHEIPEISPVLEEKCILSEDDCVTNIVEEFGNENEKGENKTVVLENSAFSESETGLGEKGLLMEINMQTLGLALEKIEEDDGVSASTTASSETPDTETVIEHFPTNISPLPNDDVMEPLNHEGTDYELNALQNPEVNSDSIVANTDVAGIVSVPHINKLQFSKDVASISDCDSTEIQDEKCNSSTNTALLDVSDIDEMERRLMLQLEQEEIMLEDINVDNGELKDEVERQLLYLSDDSYLLDDLDAPPRHISPPSEPPPPPPESEYEENKSPSLMRVNSTKRIKKEIWRRRSDFLGLDSPEAISVDDILPPPPGLEELFKSEMEMGREQKLWLEKRLSLTDPAPSDDFTSSDVLTTSTLSHGGALSLEHILKVLDAEVYDAVSCDKSQSDIEDTSERHLAEEQVASESLDDSDKTDTLGSSQPNSIGSQYAIESPVHKAKHHIQTLGAAPRAKIMDSNKWITQTEKASPKKQKMMDPVFRDSGYNHNFWISQEANHRSPECLTSKSYIPADRRFSMPPSYKSRHPDVTVRTWGDRELESYPQQQRPKSCLWQTQQSSIPESYNCSELNEESKITLAENQSSTENNTLMDTVGGIPRRCSYCGDELTDGSAMGIDALELYFHIECFRCCACQIQLGNGSCGTDVQVKNNQLYCQSCFRVD